MNFVSEKNVGRFVWSVSIFGFGNDCDGSVSVCVVVLGSSLFHTHTHTRKELDKKQQNKWNANGVRAVKKNTNKQVKISGREKSTGITRSAW